MSVDHIAVHVVTMAMAFMAAGPVLSGNTTESGELMLEMMGPKEAISVDCRGDGRRFS